MDLFSLAETITDYLKRHGVKFSEEGYPNFTDDMLLREVPEEVAPIGRTSFVKDKSRTLLVSFRNDEEIYKYLFSLNDTIKICKSYLGFGGFDLSPRINWDVKLQRFNILLNMLADAYLAVNGIKLMPNFRIGCLETIDVLSSYPQHTWFTVGALGGGRGRIKINKMYLMTKLLITNPDMLIYYGKLKPEYAEILDQYGVSYRVFEDFQRISRKRRKEIA